MSTKNRNNKQQHIKRRNLKELAFVSQSWQELDLFNVCIRKLKAKVKSTLMKSEDSVKLEGVCTSLKKKIEWNSKW